MKTEEKCALSEHLIRIHPNVTNEIEHFTIETIAKGRDPIDTDLKEAHYIKHFKPTLNRKRERPDL